ncbi:MAG: hypothetical protein M3137_00850 [Actinomycetota bacterium]|nr:hypothetical protein [Actinomycetota bacterium]
MLLIDTANVVGSRPDGWWRDRAGATGRLIERVGAATRAGRLPEPVVMVLEGAGRRAVAEGVGDDVELVHAPGQGDDTLVELATAAGAGPVAIAPGSAETVMVVTADRALAERLRAVGAAVVGPRWLLARLDGLGKPR